MKIFALVSLTALAACVAPPADQTSSQSQSPAKETADALQSCDPASGQYAVGQSLTDQLIAKLKAQTGSETVRVIAPGMAVTMDYRSDRLNINHDDKKVITKVDCG